MRTGRTATQRPNITFLVVALALAQLWAQVIRRADDRGGHIGVGAQYFRDAEIPELDGALLRSGKHDILGLEIAMQNIAVEKTYMCETCNHEVNGALENTMNNKRQGATTATAGVPKSSTEYTSTTTSTSTQHKQGLI